MKKIVLAICIGLPLMAGCFQHQTEAPYNRNNPQNEYERTFRKYVFASCINEGKFYATYALAQVNAKPTDCDPRYKVTFVNGPCKGETILTTDVITKTAPVANTPLTKGEIVLRDFWNPKKGIPELEDMDRWNRAVVYDTSRMEQGVVELEFPHDKNDFMAPREFIFVRNVRFIQEPEQKDIRTWL